MQNLNEQIKAYAKRNPVRFHMPGHKGVFDPLDVTELFFTDNLYNPDENLRIILDLEKRVSRVFFSGNNIQSNISCGGATLCIQAALLAVIRENTNNKKYIICARDCHVSFINALALLDIEPLWVYPNEDINEIFEKNYNKNIIAAFVTSPDYYGNMRDIREITQVCKKNNVPLIVDNSHGAHLAFYKNGLLHPLNCGADISIDSIHKTLPALTGSALIHSTKKYNIREAMKVFASTSPSSLILQSIEKMLDFLETDGVSEHSRLLADILKFKSHSREYFPANQVITDPFRIVLNCKNLGEKLYYFLFKQNITCEFYEQDRVIIIPSVFNKSSDFEVLASTLQIFSRENNIINAHIQNYSFTKPKRALSLNEVIKSPRQRIETSAALGRICAESIFAYPPGIPVILPGETIDTEILPFIKDLRDKIYVTIH